MARPSLKAVTPADLPDPPYEANTKANGYKPEVDWQRIKSSRTWRLCPQQYRPWLLMIWLESWNEVPVGSWEADDELIAAAVGMDADYFAGARKYLMRGWQLHSDGRLYHAFITAQVEAMTSKRRSERDRKRKQREGAVPRDKANVPRDKTHVPAESGGVPRVSAPEQEQEQEQEDSEANASAAVAAAPSAKTAVWNLGETLLGSRAAVGRLIKQHGEAHVFHAIAQAASHEAADPSAYIRGLLKSNNHETSKRHSGTAAARGEQFGAECWGRIHGGDMD